ncbi:hypothetical protein PGT21_009146 [Puccinia graminis f. sp. tritici]|uniref:Uncharacterized protein n=1 Tax=Puccinia graminis f. sp. tritici TaxID=56615 RepID=A0A5B0S6D0_PUCGR|nr:hypothetical protein PGT21_009146 [Puccinia graminis f. sp. tritici]KAA1133460.1 hypothetical protein PGTUg99_014678 [Puccinia graminis f. sp. tritici]
MTEKRITIHRRLALHQKRLAQARNRTKRTVPMNIQPTAEYHEPVPEGPPESPLDESCASASMEEMENPTNIADGIREAQEEHSRQLRIALDLINRMSSNDFFDAIEQPVGGPEDYDRMDWLYDEMDAEQMDGVDEDPLEDVEENPTEEQEWYPFKNKMVC